MIATLTPKVQWDSTNSARTPIMAASATMSLSTFPKISGAEPLVRERAPLKIAIGATETTPTVASVTTTAIFSRTVFTSEAPLPPDISGYKRRTK